MLIKSADDKSKRFALLQGLQQSPMLDMRQKEWLRDELRNLRTGIKGKQADAYYLDGHYIDSQNSLLLHALRLAVDAERAPIGRLVLARASAIFNEAIFEMLLKIFEFRRRIQWN
jgi:hypothetical protein